MGVRSAASFSYRGIPYAQPPLGVRRFAAPVPVEPWPGIRRADRFGPEFPQRGMAKLIGALLPSSTQQSLDACSVNVWTPAEPGPNGHAVLVWFHGGGFRAGSGADEIYDGSALAEQGIVTVTCNYRLGAEGFLHLGEQAPDPDVAGCMGLADQVAVLRWVRDNIAAFGGDPARVTIAGQSAGAMSVAALMTVPAASGLFHRAICQSGGADKVVSAETSREIGRRTLTALGLDGGGLEGLAELDPAEVHDAEVAVAEAFAEGELDDSYGPAGHGIWLQYIPAYGTAYLPRHPLQAIKDGAAAGIDLLVGDTADESSIFFVDVPDETLVEIARRTLRKAVGPEVAEEVWDGLGRALPNASLRERALLIEAEAQIGLPVRCLAHGAAGGRARVFKYRFDCPGTAFPELGTYHMLDIPYVFGTCGSEQGRSMVGEASSTALAAVGCAWVSFIKDGTPRFPDGSDWPAYTTVGRELVTVSSRTSVTRDDGCLGWAEWTRR